MGSDVSPVCIENSANTNSPSVLCSVKRAALNKGGVLVGMAFSLFSLSAQLPLDTLDDATLRSLRNSFNSVGQGNGLSSQAFGGLNGLGFPQASSLTSQFLGESGPDRSELEAMIQQYGGLLTPEQVQQIESFIASDGQNSLGLTQGLDGVVNELTSTEDAETFEAAPVEKESNVEPLFLSGRTEGADLPRFGVAEGKLTSSLKPFLFVPYVFQDGTFNRDIADISLPPFYFDLKSIEVFTLYTDNALLSSETKEEDIVLATSLDFSLLVQVRDSFRLASGASFVYLPLSNEFGFSSIGGAGLRGGLIGQTEASYQVPIGQWDLSLHDRFSARNYSFSGGRDSGFSVFSDQDENQGGLLGRSLVDVEGHNVAVSQIGLNGLKNQRQERFDSDGTEFRNQIGGSLARLLPGDNRLTFGGGHSDSWFTGFNAGLPKSTDRASVSLSSEREETRFKPTLSHSFYRTNLRPAWDQLSSLSLNGPISDYIDLTTRLGYFAPAGIDTRSVLWGVDIGHQLRPSLYHSIYITRGAAGPNIDLSRNLGWRLSWIVGPYTELDFLVEQREFLDLDGDGSGSNQFRMGAILNQELGKDLSGTFGVIYRELNYSSVNLGDNQVWTSRVHLQKMLTESLSLGLTYQLEDWVSSVGDGSFVENLVILTVSKRL